nr:Chain P, Envelope polyprotein gp160 [synthetic construct]
WNWFDITNK